MKAARENGKLSWIKGSHALWWSSGKWRVGNKGSIGSTTIGLRTLLDLPYSSLRNQWEYFDGNKWVKPINEISVRCTRFETVGKYM